MKKHRRSWRSFYQACINTHQHICIRCTWTVQVCSLVPTLVILPQREQDDARLFHTHVVCCSHLAPLSTPPSAGDSLPVPRSTRRQTFASRIHTNARASFRHYTVESRIRIYLAYCVRPVQRTVPSCACDIYILKVTNSFPALLSPLHTMHINASIYYLLASPPPHPSYHPPSPPHTYVFDHHSARRYIHVSLASICQALIMVPASVARSATTRTSSTRVARNTRSRRVAPPEGPRGYPGGTGTPEISRIDRDPGGPPEAAPRVVGGAGGPSVGYIRGYMPKKHLTQCV